MLTMTYDALPEFLDEQRKKYTDLGWDGMHVLQTTASASTVEKAIVLAAQQGTFAPPDENVWETSISAMGTPNFMPVHIYMTPEQKDIAAVLAGLRCEDEDSIVVEWASKVHAALMLGGEKMASQQVDRIKAENPSEYDTLITPIERVSLFVLAPYMRG